MAVTSSSTASEPSGVIEVLGAAGSGKSSLIAALCLGSPAARPLSIYCTPRNLPLWLWSGAKLLTQFRSIPSPEPNPWRKRRWMIRLKAAEGILRRETAKGPGVIVFDQGPVYTLARLGPMRSSSSIRGDKPLWQKAIPVWARALDAIVLLDAPDEVLLHRIHMRPKPHRLRRAPYNQALYGLDEERAIYETVIQVLSEARASLPVIRFDTAKLSVTAITAEVLKSLDRGAAIAAPNQMSPPTRHLPSRTLNQTPANGADTTKPWM